MQTPTRPELKVTVFSDYICPFCYVGDTRLERLRDEFDLRINWCFVELHPETPPGGRAIAELNYPESQWRDMMDALERMAAEEGLPLLPLERTYNSRNALLLAEAAKAAGADVFYRLHRRLFRACFAEGRDIGDRDVLRDLAGECGVPAELTEAAWREARHGERLRQNLAAAGELGLTGVPTFFFGERPLTGAVSTETLRRAARAAPQAEPS